MIKIREAVIVEGKYDKIRLSSLIDAFIIPTDGFAIFKDKEKVNLIRNLAKIKGILILTDSDSAGFKIRNYLTGCIPNEYIKQAYIPEILGKERRKDEFSKEGLIGVEGMSTDTLTKALVRAGVYPKEAADEKSEKREVTVSDFFDDGLSGKKDSAKKRCVLLGFLGYPQKLSQKSLLSVINFTMDYNEYKKLITELFK